MNIINKKEIKDKKLLVICPTRSRPSRAQNLLDSFDGNSLHETTGIIFLIDQDDDKKLEYIKMCGENWAYVVCDIGMTMPQKLNTAIRELCPDYEYYMFAGDDHLIETFGYDLKMVKKIEDNGGWGMAFGDDTIQGDTIPTHIVISGNIIRSLGWFYLPFVQHLYGDNAWKVIGEGLGRIWYMPEITIRHIHPQNGVTKTDAQYDRVNSQQMYQQDGDAFDRWFQQSARFCLGKLVRDIMKDKGFKKTVALTMIVGQDTNIKELRRCLDSCKDWIDELCVYINWPKHKNPWKVNNIKKFLESYAS